MFIKTTVRLYTGTFKALFSNFESFLKICWAWFVLLFGFQIVFGLIAFSDAQTSESLGSTFSWIDAVFLPLSIASSASIAVAWHRCLLLNEAPSIIHLTVGMRELVYIVKFIMVLLLVALMIVPVLLLSLLVGSTGGFFFPIISITFIAVCSFVVLVVYVRLSLILPAASLDERLTLSEAYSKSRGLGGPMVLAGIGASITIFAPLVILFSLVAIGGGGAGVAMAVAILGIGFQVCFTALQIGIFTGGYYILREREMTGVSDPPQN